VAATAATVAVVATLGHDATPNRGPDRGAVAGAPSPSGSTSTSTSTSTGTDAAGPLVPVYYVGDTPQGPRLFREFHHAPSGVDPRLAAARLAVSGTPTDPDYRSLWPPGMTVLGMSSSVNKLGELSIDLDGPAVASRPAGMTDGEAQLALQQVVWSVQGAAQEQSGFLFTEGGRRVGTTLGLRVPRRYGALAPDDVLAPVQVDDPADGTTVGGTFTLRGRANAFEATVQWELVQGTTVVKRGFTTAQECCTLSPYSTRITGVAPGDYTLVVHGDDPTGGENGPPAQDTKRITVE
jgi:hypothetical protein